MNRFTNQVVLVSGAASGIGLAAARAFAAEGAKVVLADLSAQKLAMAVESIRKAGGTASSVVADVTDPESCLAMVAHAVATYGALHIAFNNAGIAAPIVPSFEESTIADWDRTIKTNVSAVFYAMKAEVPAMRASGGTAIVNTASVTSVMAGPGMPAYIASKHAVAGLTKASSLDLIPYGIRVNAVCPGITDTPMLSGAPPEARAGMAKMTPIGRLATADEIAKAVLFLASDAASYMVGSLMMVDGGVSLP
jgi:NAD(P)-dependent dehydrogenase (short-subunit alcohol dehydrogenase family)